MIEDLNIMAWSSWRVQCLLYRLYFLKKSHLKFRQPDAWPSILVKMVSKSSVISQGSDCGGGQVWTISQTTRTWRTWMTILICNIADILEWTMVGFKGGHLLQQDLFYGRLWLGTYGYWHFWGLKQNNILELRLNTFPLKVVCSGAKIAALDLQPLSNTSDLFAQ